MASVPGIDAVRAGALPRFQRLGVHAHSTATRLTLLSGMSLLPCSRPIAHKHPAPQTHLPLPQVGYSELLRIVETMRGGLDIEDRCAAMGTR